ncbi:alpha/beta-hydrolase [Imleria badia]|nr:alpha/beta-hydrolase [Imleria badia]
MVLIRCFTPSVLHVFAFIASALAVPTSRSIAAPLVTLDYGAFRGFNSAGDTESFLGIPFAQPPVGQLRFNNPVPPQRFSGVRNTTSFGDACPQQPILAPNELLPNNSGLSGVTYYLGELLPSSSANASEDCLYLNVVRPAGVSEGVNLPVIVWIYGGNIPKQTVDPKFIQIQTIGAFEYGDASAYDGTQIVSRSLGLKSHVIYVSFNYRVNAFGFLGGKEVQAAGLGNFGLHDQRLALQWVHKYIFLFGGNPQQVILWGQSAGSISVMLQMVAYDGQLNGLFQGAIMESGSASPGHDITSQQAQDKYDFILQQTNCAAANNTLDCLRQAPYESILAAVLQTPPLLSYQALNTSWKPLIDGVFLKQSIRQSLSQGKYAQVPAILGDVDDEGTLFSLYSFNVTNEPEFADYIQTNFLVGATKAEIKKVRKLYPKDPILGSPFDVGTNDTLTPEFKRISSFQGDFFYQVPRRYALSYLSRTQDVWSYREFESINYGYQLSDTVWKRNKYVPGIGSFHGSDLQEFYNLTGSPEWVGTDALVNFAYNLNPNVPANDYPSGAASSLLSNASWPQYYRHSPQLLTFEDPNVLTLTNDTYRAKQIEFLDEIQDLMGL